jgi:hypothetical protein
MEVPDSKETWSTPMQKKPLLAVNFLRWQLLLPLPVSRRISPRNTRIMAHHAGRHAHATARRDARFESGSNAHSATLRVGL